jgi:hypothetical protein
MPSLAASRYDLAKAASRGNLGEPMTLKEGT